MKGHKLHSNLQIFQFFVTQHIFCSLAQILFDLARFIIIIILHIELALQNKLTNIQLDQHRYMEYLFIQIVFRIKGLEKNQQKRIKIGYFHISSPSFCRTSIQKKFNFLFFFHLVFSSMGLFLFLCLTCLHSRKYLYCRSLIQGCVISEANHATFHEALTITAFSNVSGYKSQGSATALVILDFA